MIEDDTTVKDAFVVNTGGFNGILAGTPCLLVETPNKSISGSKWKHTKKTLIAVADNDFEDDDEYDDDDDEEYEDDDGAVHLAVPMPADHGDMFASKHTPYNGNTKVVMPFSVNCNDPNRKRVMLAGQNSFSIMEDDSKKGTSLLDRASLTELAPIPSGQGNKNEYFTNELLKVFDFNSIVRNNEFTSVTSIDIINSSDAVAKLLRTLIKIFPNVFTLNCDTKRATTRQKDKKEYDLRLAVTVSNVENHMAMLEQFNGVFLHLCILDLKKTNIVGHLYPMFEATLLFSDSEQVAFVDGDRFLQSTDIKSMYNYINKNIRSLKTLGRHNK